MMITKKLTAHTRNVNITPDLEYNDDFAKGATEHLGANEDVGYHRSLGRGQIMMMTFGAGIGSGLWVGTGTALKYAGPGGIAIAYIIPVYVRIRNQLLNVQHVNQLRSRMVVYLQYISVGEMTTYKPVHGEIIRQCIEYVEPAFGFAVGNFFFSVLELWPQTQVVPLAAYITVFLIIIALANSFGVRIYGHVDIPATHGAIEFWYWRNPGALNNGINGISKAFVQALFSFGGGKYIAVIAGEARDSRRTTKKTVHPVFWRMFAFFVVNIWLIWGCVVVYSWFSSLVSVSTLFQWSSIFISHIQFRRGLAAQGIDIQSLRYQARAAPYAQHFALVLIWSIAGSEIDFTAAQAFDEEDRARAVVGYEMAGNRDTKIMQRMKD
ncbi:uncharacterized protein BO97DRAFT_475902 [Aspergillus homomorphus CBS 101889]|uniref:Amino acid permease/ SLC12A domain-containing protein n=1 Tax=Aspergillus homomorphus (strain CBS 101889) TaxID=1450537 RepID=A0A395I914_ASPHC|nr:hypothetical protein BO97DRAFT_475902 [Aspergillus homomorphus CBS 101889]RAL15548.1 hypothetical protein BO97DRAFT_475902 [Aspergillus homomorphus CBS 101889]